MSSIALSISVLSISIVNSSKLVHLENFGLISGKISIIAEYVRGFFGSSESIVTFGDDAGLISFSAIAFGYDSCISSFTTSA